MTTMARPAEVRETRSLWQAFIQLIRLVSGYYLWTGAQRDLWRERPDIRQKILVNIAFCWIYAWVVISYVIVQTWNFNFLLPFFSVFGALAVFMILYLGYGRNRAALTMAGHILIVLSFWLVLINIPVFFFRDVDRLTLLLANLIDSNPWLSYVIWGAVWIVLTCIVLIMMPIWMIELQYGEVFLVRERGGDGFRLDSRPAPRVDREVIDALVAGGMPPDLIDTFIHFNGPAYMRKSLIDRLGTESDMVTRRMLQTLFDQLADQSRTPPPILWVSAMDQERLLWDRKRSVPVSLEIDQLVTKDGHPVRIALEFRCVFDPEAIRKPEFRLGLADILSVRAMEERIQTVMKAGAISAARLYFIRLPLRAALTEGTVEDFRRDFPALMAGFEGLGIVVSPASVLCRPVLDQLVLEAETEMLASRARALSETAKLQALIEKVMLHGVPPDLLGGLLFLDQSTSGEYKALQVRPGTDMLPLPEASNQQQARFMYQKTHGDIPADRVPELSADRPDALPPGEDSDMLTPPSTRKPDWFNRGDRYTSNLGDNKKKRD